MKKACCLLIVFLALFLISACTKTKISYWPPSKYGGKIKKSEEKFKKGKKEGLSVWWHENGNKQMECNYKEDKLNGQFKRWYHNSNPEIISNYSDNSLEGPAKTFYMEGGLETEMNYKNNLLDGIYKQYWANGELKAEGNYSKGLYQGKWKYYDISGIKTGEAEFLNGDGSKTEFSIISGSKIIESQYKKNKKEGTEIWWNEKAEIIREIIYKEDRIIKTINY